MRIRPPGSSGPAIAVLTVLTLELLRLSGPLIASAPGGTPGVVAVALLVFTAPALAWPLVRAAGDRAARASIVSVAALVAARLALQAFPGPPYALGPAATALALIALVIAVARADGGAGAAGLPTGIALDVAVRSLFSTWDVVWQPGWPAWLVTGLLCAAALALTWRAPGGTLQAGPRAWVAGPFLGLTALALGDPAFAAARSGLPLPVAAGTLIVGALFAVVVAGEAGHTAAFGRRGVLWGAGAALGVSLAAASLLDGPAVLVALGAAQLCAAVLLARALTGTGREGVGAAGLGAGLGYALTVLPCQHETPDGLPALLWPLAATAALTLAAGAGRARRAPRGMVAHEFHLAGGCALALLAPVIALVTTPSPAAKPPRGQLKLLSWNVHHGPAPAVDPEAIARVIEERDPDVVLLQAVARGLPGGGVDLAEWLTRRLGPATRIWAPAADRRTGDLILARVPLTERRAGGPPYAALSYATGTVTLDGGRPLRLTTAHREGNGPPIGALPTAWHGGRPAVIAGDLGSTAPAERLALTRAGFTRAAPRTPSPDHVWATRDLVFRGFAVLAPATASGRRPMETTVTIGGSRPGRVSGP
ncbi:endonuclease/exonuclease/phosphatase family protein [Spongiactinospora sp. TRM90649]|uniref:endonuclease/exonuclease/phosphatase family protein n=1 Tax=Spongiactinospora sp. TRM90649 TaxID=3031114 RepID=UPI0023F86642|nr:endonuclease/exonuclease/phosphatase family protein [Spongiactinospora sp. TRM90649]MDF5752635.1 hypothetical protein [Spongiactinospora sp. TRM90649]